jgi:phospholipase C
MAWTDEIRHVVVLMLENQSFDRMLGFLRPEDPAQQLDGLSGDETVPVVPEGPSRLVRVRRASAPAAYVTDPSPGHQLQDVTVQLFGREQAPDPPAPTMSGFVWNYAHQTGDDGRPIGLERAEAVMDCLDPALVPVISTLARSFVVCDRWFSSVPGPTWPNRFFVHAATSAALIESPTDPQQIAGFLGRRFRMRTIYENLMAAGRTWAVYFGDHAQASAISSLHRHNDLFRRLETFAGDVASGALPSYSFLEPVYMDTSGSPASDQHPPHDLREGERLIAWVYDTLRSNETLWGRTLLVLLYDEHGGFYDHVPPPASVPPDDASAASAAFRFDRLGVRVPALLVSPWVARGRVDHRLYDHTSLLASVKELFELPDFLTRRDAQASVFDPANFLDVARSPADMPRDLASLVPPRASIGGGIARKLSTLQESLLALGAALKTPGA